MAQSWIIYGSPAQELDLTATLNRRVRRRCFQCKHTKVPVMILRQVAVSHLVEAEDYLEYAKGLFRVH
jgi:hypothetical protein